MSRCPKKQRSKFLDILEPSFHPTIDPPLTHVAFYSSQPLFVNITLVLYIPLFRLSHVLHRRPDLLFLILLPAASSPSILLLILRPGPRPLPHPRLDPRPHPHPPAWSSSSSSSFASILGLIHPSRDHTN